MTRFFAILPLMISLLGGCRDTVQTGAENTIMEGKPTNDWVHGDGGPLIFLQSGALGAWQGASDFDNSILAGGAVRTDYDVICELTDGVNVIHHHGRDMIVMADVEWASRIIERRDGIYIFQSLGHDGSAEQVIDKAISGPPDSVFPFSQIDREGRLMIGADEGVDPMYDYAKIEIEPGPVLFR